MPVPLVRLPALEFPSNALLNFDPINNALTERNRARELDIRNQIEENRFARMHALDRERLGLERSRFGLEGERLGLERSRFGLEESREREQREERERIRLANEAFAIRGITNPDERRARTERLLTPELMTRLGIGRFDPEGGPANLDRALDYLINQPQDRTRYQPNILHGAPGTGFFELQTGPDGQRLRPIGQVPPRPPPLSDTALTRLSDEGTRISNLFRLSESWDNAFSLPGGINPLIGGGDIRNWFGRHYSNAPDTARRAAAWWQDYQRSSELIERHGLFGSALTAPELAAWRAATITPNMTPDAIRNNLRVQREIVEGRTLRHARALVMQGHDPRIIATTLGINPDALRTTSGQTPPPPTGPGGLPPPPPPAAGTVSEGTIIRNGRGDRMILRNGQWQPLAQ